MEKIMDLMNSYVHHPNHPHRHRVEVKITVVKLSFLKNEYFKPDSFYSIYDKRNKAKIAPITGRVSEEEELHALWTNKSIKFKACLYPLPHTDRRYTRKVRTLVIRQTSYLPNGQMVYINVGSAKYPLEYCAGGDIDDVYKLIINDEKDLAAGYVAIKVECIKIKSLFRYQLYRIMTGAPVMTYPAPQTEAWNYCPDRKKYSVNTMVLDVNTDADLPSLLSTEDVPTVPHVPQSPHRGGFYTNFSTEKKSHHNNGRFSDPRLSGKVDSGKLPKTTPPVPTGVPAGGTVQPMQSNRNNAAFSPSAASVVTSSPLPNSDISYKKALKNLASDSASDLGISIISSPYGSGRSSFTMSESGIDISSTGGDGTGTADSDSMGYGDSNRSKVSSDPSCSSVSMGGIYGKKDEHVSFRNNETAYIEATHSISRSRSGDDTMPNTARGVAIGNNKRYKDTLNAKKDKEASKGGGIALLAANLNLSSKSASGKRGSLQSSLQSSVQEDKEDKEDEERDLEGKIGDGGNRIEGSHCSSGSAWNPYGCGRQYVKPNRKPNKIGRHLLDAHPERHKIYHRGYVHRLFHSKKDVRRIQESSFALAEMSLSMRTEEIVAAATIDSFAPEQTSKDVRRRSLHSTAVQAIGPTFESPQATLSKQESQSLSVFTALVNKHISFRRASKTEGGAASGRSNISCSSSGSSSSSSRRRSGSSHAINSDMTISNYLPSSVAAISADAGQQNTSSPDIFQKAAYIANGLNSSTGSSDDPICRPNSTSNIGDGNSNNEISTAASALPDTSTVVADKERRQVMLQKQESVQCEFGIRMDEFDYGEEEVIDADGELIAAGRACTSNEDNNDDDSEDNDKNSDDGGEHKAARKKITEDKMERLRTTASGNRLLLALSLDTEGTEG